MIESNEFNAPLANNHISVDCVVLGWDGDKLNVLLLSRESEGPEYNDMKLPGSLIYQDEDLDQAAERVLRQLTGLEHPGLHQFKAYGSKDRTRSPKDVVWLERAQNARVERIVTIAYIATIRITRQIEAAMKGHNVSWVPVEEVGQLAFDHNIILKDALAKVKVMTATEPDFIFSLLPTRFTLAQLRLLTESLTGRKIDNGNFHKKISTLEYVVPLDEYQKGVAHRAARYYRFDRKIYKGWKFDNKRKN